MKLKACLESLQDNFLQVSDASEQEIIDITTDSRQVKKGSLFIAIQGSVSNGEDFISQAVANGCIAVIAENDYQLSCISIKVKDAYLATSQLAEFLHEYPAKSLNLIGITGTNGKSSIAMLIYWLLKQNGVVSGLSGTIETSFGDVKKSSTMTTPDAMSFQRILKEMKSSAVSHVVLEVSSHALSQHRTGTHAFKTAIFTNLTQDHLDYHQDMNDYFAAKFRLFKELLSESGKAIVNIDDEYGKKIFGSLEKEQVITVSSHQSADVQISNISCGFSGTIFDLKIGAENYKVNSPLLGEFNVMNLVQAFIALELEGISIERSLELIQDFPGVPGRMQVFKKKHKMVVVDYAHTPDALEKALSCLRPLTVELHCLFGCGGDRDISKRSLMGQVAEQYSDRLWLTDDNPRTESSESIVEDILGGVQEPQKVKVELDRARCIQHAVEALSQEGILLVAGKGHEDYQIYGTEKRRFCDKETVMKVLEQAG